MRRLGPALAEEKNEEKYLIFMDRLKMEWWSGGGAFSENSQAAELGETDLSSLTLHFTGLFLRLPLPACAGCSRVSAAAPSSFNVFFKSLF